MLTLLWSPKALDELDNLTDYIGEHNPSAADRLTDRIESCAEQLTQFPYMHRAGRVPGTREAVVTPNYVLVYRVTEDAVEIVHLLHTRQQYP